MEGSANNVLPFSMLFGEFLFAVAAVQILVCAPLAYRLLRSLALREVSERWGRRFKAKQSCVGTGVPTVRGNVTPNNRQPVILSGGEAEVELLRVE